MTGGKWAPVPGKIPGTEINLGGHLLVLAPLNLDQIQHFGDKVESMGKAASLKDAVEETVPMIHASLVRNYPDMTPEDVRGLLDVGNFRDALNAVLNLSGYELKAPGETAPASP